MKKRTAAPVGRRQDPSGLWAEARVLASEGRMEEAMAKVMALLANSPTALTDPRFSQVRDILAASGWSARWSGAKGEGRIAILGKDGSALAELHVESRVAGATGGTLSITPTVRLRPVPSRKLSGTEKTSLARLAAGFYPILESLRAQDEGRKVKAQLEVHEASGGTGRPDLILRTTFACNQRCPFCFVLHESRSVPMADIEAALDSAAAQVRPGLSLTISGGEPLADTRLIGIIESARRRGIGEFILQTNMIGLDKPGAVERLVGLGVTGYDVSFHSHRPAMYDRITGTRGQHPRAVEALRRLLAVRTVRVTACVLLNAYNYRDLPGLMRFLGRLSKERRGDAPRPVEVCFAVMNGAGMNRASFMAVELGVAGPYVWKAIQTCRREGVFAQRFSGESALPPCVLPRPQDFVSECGFSQDRVRYADDFSGELGSVGRAKKPGCRRCPFDDRCLGVPAEYARLFGLGALKPPTRSSIAPRRGPGAGPRGSSRSGPEGRNSC